VNEDKETSSDRRVDDLMRRTADDVATLAHEYANVAKREVAAVSERAMWPGAIAAVGALLAVVGVGMLVASPAVPSTNARLRRRLHFAALAYLAFGAAGALVGGGAFVATLRHALPRTRRNVHEAVDVVRDRL
jgi:hypothetical protein